MAKLKPRARLIRTIGDKLISGPEAAIIELVKNAYDADSPSVLIKIVPPSGRTHGKVIVTDTGHGMTYDNLINDWLEPATDSKLKRNKSLSGKRTVLGAKGVGRFASASIGKKLKLTSIASLEGIYQVNILNLDWRIFEQEKYLEDIDIDIISHTITGNIFTGVEIEISDLSTIWDEIKLTNLIKELRRLAIQNRTSDGFRISLDLSEYNEKLEIPYNINGSTLLRKHNQNIESYSSSAPDDKDLSSIIIPYNINEKSDYHLNGKFDKDGNFEGHFNIVRGDNTPKNITITAPLYSPGETSCGPLDIDIKIYDLEKESVEALFKRMGLDFSIFGLRNARKLINDGTGIAIYRSGFRVRPYGEPDHDWLKLEKRRVQDPSRKIGHAQVAGSINISNENESNLIERSSREGLETNGSYSRMVKLIEGLFLQIEPKRQDYRERAGISRKAKPSMGKAREIANLDSISKAVQALSPEKRNPILLKIEKESQALTQALDEIEEYQKLLESRAALGLVVGQVIHDGRTYLEPIISSARSIIDHAPYILDKDQRGELVRKYYPTYGQAIQTGAFGLTTLFKSLDPISGRKRGKPIVFDIYKVITDTLNLLSEKLIENDIEVISYVTEKENAYGYVGDLQAALMNIIDNAIYWLSSVKIEVREIVISCEIANNMNHLSVSNNGPLINDHNRKNIFDAGVSHKQDGHGLGLSIAREACRNSKGDLKLTSIEPKTIFTIEFPISQQDI
ncbi:TPA: ATP-binding protein [Yersinia enterocolitica]